MVFVDTGSVQVNFPFEPYACQTTYMSKVIECLKNGVNGILESPTGTGKTLCLLCGSLAWLEDKKAQLMSQRWRQVSELPDGLDEFKERLAQSLDEAAGSWSGETAAPKIIYASRTHSQLSQAIQELKRTAYRQVSVLGSREQMCIHPQVMKEDSNMAKVHMCRAKVTSRSCHFYNTVENQKCNFQNQVMDIEDLVMMGKKHNCCPYYMSRELKADADIVFLPYNYLLDPKSRKAHAIQLQGSALIFDEAHNLEKICEDSASFDLTSRDLAAAITDLKELSDTLTDMIQQDESDAQFASDGCTGLGQDFTLKDVYQLKAQLHDLEQRIDGIQLTKAEEGVTKPGKYIFELFEQVNLTFNNKSAVINLLDKMVTHLTNESSSTFRSRGAGLSKYADVVKIVFSRDMDPRSSLSSHQEAVSKHYKVNIRMEKERKKPKGSGGWDTLATASKNGERVLSYWCFSSGHTMEELCAQGVRTIILTSGTLSPMTSFCTEMGIDFRVQLENPHVIEPHQVWLGTVSKGPDATKLNSSYANRFREDYQSSLGNAVVNFSRVVPRGLLLFFPSYPVMQACLDNWQNKKIRGRVEQYKPIFVEPKGKCEFQTAMECYYERVNDDTQNGAVFAAVCRGKVSEGLDFSDNNGRAVVITGLPFPPRMDPKVMMKMKYLDEVHSQNPKSLTGQQWYRQQASRAVNQAIGRVIRHKQDYGAIILCDERFASRDSQSQLPAWIRPASKTFPNFGLAMRDLMLFFKKCEQLMPAPMSGVKKPTERNKDGGSGVCIMSSRPCHVPASNPATKASSVNVHVKSLRGGQEPSHELSLAHMTEQYGGGRNQSSVTTSSRRGLLHALQNTKDTTCTESENRLKPTKSDVNVTLCEKKQNSRKKIMLKTSSRNALLSKETWENVDDYIKKVKTTLSGESYGHFTSTLVNYKKTENIDELVSGLAGIFTDTNNNYPLFRGFYRFVRSRHREQFHQVCEDLTGDGCGYQRDSENAGKKRHIEHITTDTKEKRQKLAQIDVLDSKTCSMDTKTQLNAMSNVNNLDCNTHLNGISASLPAGETSTALVSQQTLQPDPSQTVQRTNIFTALMSQNGHCTSTSAVSSDNRPAGTDVESTQKSKAVVFEKSSKVMSASLKDRILSASIGSGEHCSTPIIPDERTTGGVMCSHCRKQADVPLKAHCNHICCLACWKICIQEMKKCPECGKTVKRKHLARLFFGS